MTEDHLVEGLRQKVRKYSRNDFDELKSAIVFASNLTEKFQVLVRRYEVSTMVLRGICRL